MNRKGAIMNNADKRNNDSEGKLHIMDDSERSSKRVLEEPPLHSSSRERDAAIQSLALEPDDELMDILSKDDDGDDGSMETGDAMQTEDDGE